MAADYTRVIVFKVEDQAIKRATDRITRSLEKVEKSVSRIEKQVEAIGRGGLLVRVAKDVDEIGKSANRSSISLSGLSKLLRDIPKSMMKIGGGTAIGTKSITEISRLIDKITGLQTSSTGPINFLKQLTRISSIATGIGAAIEYAPAIYRATSATTKWTIHMIQSLKKIKAESIRTFMENPFFPGFAVNKEQKITPPETSGGLTGMRNLFAPGEAALAGMYAPKIGRNMYGQTIFPNAFGNKQLTSILPALQMGGIDTDSLTQYPNNLELFPKNEKDYLKQLRENILGQKSIKKETYARKKVLEEVLAVENKIEYQIKENIALSKKARNASNYGFGLAGDPVAKSIRRHRQKLAGKSIKGITNANQYGPQPLPLDLFERVGFGKRASSKGMFASPGKAGGRFKGALQSGMIGGGFPLLFGQSLGAAAAGGIGGTLGGALSPGFGFAGSIVATAAAQKIQEANEFKNSVDKLNISIKATGGTSVFTVESIKELGKQLGVSSQEALEAARSFEQFDAAARTVLLKGFGKEAIFDTLSGLKNNQTVIQGILSLQKDVGFEQSQIALEVLKTQGYRAAELFLLNKTIEKQKQQRIEASRNKNKKLDGGGYLIGDLGSMIAKTEEAKIDEEFKSIKEQAQELVRATQEWNREIEKATMITQIKDEIIKLQDPVFQLVSAAGAIGNAFSESFKGIVTGSMTAQQALANLFQRTADHFLDMAAQMIAKQIQMKIIGIGLNFLGGIGTTPSGSALKSGSFGTGVGKVTDTAASIGRHAVGGFSVQPNFTPRAFGGPVSGGSPYIVGEKGPELFVPGSSGNIVPNHEMGGANIVVNVDASGSSVEGDAGAAQELGSMLAAAIQAELVKEKRPGGLLA